MEAPLKVKKKSKKKSKSPGNLDPGAPSCVEKVDLSLDVNTSIDDVASDQESPENDISIETSNGTLANTSPETATGTTEPLSFDICGPSTPTTTSIPISASTPRSRTDSEFSELCPEGSPPSEMLSFLPHIVPTSPKIPEETGIAMRLDLSDKRSIEDIVGPLPDNLEFCQEAMPSVPTAPTTCESGDFFSLQSMKHSLDNINDLQPKPMHQILEEQEIQYQIVLPQRPIGESHVMNLYSNYLLESKESAIDTFLSTVQTSYPGFELYELLNNFMRAWNQLGGCEKSLLSYKDQCEDFEKQVWTISSERLTKDGFCLDGNTVTGTHQIHTAHLNKVVLSQLNKTLKDLKELLKDSFPLHMYTVQLCKAQIEHFFFKSFHHVTLQHSGVQGFAISYPTNDVRKDAELLKVCISTLFLFIRKPQLHTRFMQECQNWLDRSVGLLLRLATLEDHMFLLNHVTRCPAGLVGKWASKFVQVPPIPLPSNPDDYVSSYGHLHLDYALTALSCILNPVRKRSEFLIQITGSPLNTNDTSLQWVVVDSDGEDESDDAETFKENDVISLLHQVPFEALFARVLQVCRRGEDFLYGERPWTEHCHLKLLAVSNHLVEILGDGFATYNDDRYRRLVKLLGRLILHTAQYVSNHLDQISKSDSLSSHVEREYDYFLLRCVKALHRGKKIGTMQFLATIPFNLVSIEMLWEIYGLLTYWNLYDGNEMKSEDISADFEQQLVSMNESDAFYLLTAMSSMAIAREGKDNGFVRIVTIHLFQIGFLSPLTRDSCSKQARDLLSSLTRKFPHLISVLIQSIKPKMDILENMSLYLLKDLAFSYWKPSDYDLQILSNWIINFHPNCLENQMARYIIQSLNWNFDESGQLFLSVGVHRKVGLLVVESHSKWEKCQNILTESVKQVSGINLRPQDINFSAWGWEVVKRLHLHAFDQSNSSDLRLTKFIRSLPTFESHCELEALRKSVEDKHPLGSLVTLLLTPAGHSMPLICSKGFELVETLLANYKVEAVIQALLFVTPLFGGSRDTVVELKSKRFLTIVSTLLSSDMTYVRMAKNFISSEFPGAVTKLFGEMISTQLHESQRFNTNERKVVRLWVEILTGCDNWNKDNNFLYLLDILARFCFYHEDCRTYFYDYFIDLYKKMPSDNQSGLTSYLLNWSGSGSGCPTFLPNVSYPSMPYLSYFILHIEMQIENLSGFWKSVCHSMGNPKNTVDIAVKKASSSCKYNGSVNYLTIHRFAALAHDLPLEHPLVLIFWQKFFLRYFHRMSADEIYQGGVGDRFFEGMINVAFLKKLKRRIHELVQYYQTELNNFSDSVVENQPENPAVNPTSVIDFHKSRLALAQAMTLWIEDPQLHKDSLYLPALPPQFLTDKLLHLIEGSHEDWSEYVDFDEISAVSVKSVKSYLTYTCRLWWIEPQRVVRSPDWISLQGNPVEDILKRLKSYDSPLLPPPVPSFQQVLPVASPAIFTDWSMTNSTLKPHFGALTAFARSFSLQISQHTAIDCSYMEYLPELYKNHNAETVVTVRCSGTRKWEPCGGAAHILFKYKEARLNERMGHQIQLNRTEYHTLIDQKSLHPPPETMCISAVFVEDLITNLLMLHRNALVAKNSVEAGKVHEVGKELFYKIITLMNEDCNFYPPTRQLFSSFLEVLGGAFIASDEKQYMTLVNICIRNSHFSHVVGAVAPHINLVNCNSKHLIEIYETVASIAKREPDMAFVILSKLDLGTWLGKTKPSPAERSKLLSIMWKVLTSEGIQPSDSALLVYGCFQQHFRTMHQHDFPQHYGEVLSLLLQGMEQQSVPLELCYDFFQVLSGGRSRLSRGADQATKNMEIRRFATEYCALPHELILETVTTLGNHFTKERLAIGLYGLYPKYRTYSEPLSAFLQMVALSVTVSSLKRHVGHPPSEVINQVWSSLFELYSPWILPYDQKMIQQKCSTWIQHFNFDATSVLHPWIPVDAQFAAVFVDNFSEAVVFLADNLAGASELLSRLLNFYLSHFALAGVKDHVMCIVNNSFINYIPWRVYWPTLGDVEAMNKVVEKYLPAAHGFLGCIFVQVNWPEWVHDIVNANTTHQSVSLLNQKIYSVLLNLTVRLANDGVARELLQWGEVIERAMRMNWSHVPTSSVECILNWFVMSVDPRVVLSSSSNHPMELASLYLLKVACGFLEASVNSISTEQTEDVARKRYLFVRSYVRLLLSVASKFKNYLQTEVKSIEKSVQAMVTDIVSVGKHEKQTKEDLMPLLRELFTLMGNHYLGTLTRNAFIEWCDQNKDVPLPVLYGFIYCSLDNKVPAYTTVPLIEVALKLCFRHREASWESIVDVAVVTDNATELSSYFEVAYRDGHYLVLYCLLLRRFGSLSQGGIGTVSFLFDVLKNFKPKESNEVGVPLVCEILLKLNFHLLLDAKKGSSVEKNVRKFLNTFATHMLNLGDDRGGWGLLGALGLGQSSTLSTRGRLFCRCIGTFVQAQLPTGYPVRTKPEDSGHFITEPQKPHPDIWTNVEKLDSLKLVRQYADLSECIDQALEFIKDGTKSLSLSDIESFVQKLVGFLFVETFLYKEVER